MPDENTLGYMDANYTSRMALVAETTGGESEPEIVGVARYHTDPASNDAEVTFVIRDDWQGHGVGGALFQHIVEVATERGVTAFTAEVLIDNAHMLHVLHKSGLPISSTLADGVYRLRMELAPGAEPPPTAPGEPDLCEE
jgi:GNAT superfamily N-acetyltransferase